MVKKSNLPQFRIFLTFVASKLIGIPDKLLTPWIAGRDYIKPADEGEAVAIACGVWYATRKRATVFMSADGFANALNPITNLVIPEGIEMDLVISYGRQEPPHKVMSDILLPLIDLLKYDPEKINIKYIKKES